MENLGNQEQPQEEHSKEQRPVRKEDYQSAHELRILATFSGDDDLRLRKRRKQGRNMESKRGPSLWSWRTGSGNGRQRDGADRGHGKSRILSNRNPIEPYHRYLSNFSKIFFFLFHF